MIKNNLDVETYLIKIVEQNEKIISLLEKQHRPLSAALRDEPQVDKTRLICAEKMNSLSPREHQIIELVLEGKLNKEIAYILEISLSTVESHRSNIMRKLGANNVAQLIKIYLKCQEMV